MRQFADPVLWSISAVKRVDRAFDRPLELAKVEHHVQVGKVLMTAMSAIMAKSAGPAANYCDLGSDFGVQ